MKSTPRRLVKQEVDILVVEDSPTQAESLSHLLHEHGYKIRVAANGREALAAVRERKPALVISDIVMPEMDGFTFCGKLKSKKGLRDIPVVLLSALSSADDIIKGLQCGADNFIRKPYDENDLLSRIEHLLANRELRTSENIEPGLKIRLNGEEYLITSERQQILDLLISVYQEAVRLNSKLARSYESLNGLYRIAVDLNGSLGVHAVAEKALARCFELPGVRAGWIVLCVGDAGFYTAATKNLPPALAMPGSLEGDCMCRSRLLSGELDWAVNVFECERLQKAKGDAEGLRYHASVPLWTEGKKLGVLNLAGSEQGMFREEELRILHGVGNQVAVALERAQLHEGLEKKVREKTAALEESQNELRAIYDCQMDAVSHVSLDRKIINANAAAERMFGYAVDELKGRSAEILHVDHERFTAFGNYFYEARAYEDGRPFEFEMKRKNGETFPVEVSLSFMRNDSGEPIAAVGVIRDISNRLRLEKDKLRLISIIEATPDLVGIADSEGRALYVNESGRKMLGFTEGDEIIGFPITQAHPDWARKAILEDAIPTAVRDGVWSGETVLLTRDGKEIPVSQVILAHRGLDEKIEYLSTIIRDISERKKAEEALLGRYQDLEVLHDIGQVILSSGDLERVLETTLDKVFAAGRFDLGAIRLLDRSGNFLKPVAVRGFRDPKGVRTLPVGDPTTGRMTQLLMECKEAQVIENVAASNGLRTLKQEGVRSAVLIPIRAEDQVLGAIHLGSRALRDIDPARVRFLEAVGNQVGVAVQKARLDEETKRNLERIRALHEIDTAITSTLDLSRILKVLLEKIVLFFPYPTAATVRLLDKDTGKLERAIGENLDEEEWRKRKDVGPNFSSLVAESRASLMVRNVQEDPRAQDPDFFRKHGLVSYLGVPLIAKGNVLGIIGLYTKVEHEFSQEEVGFLSTLAGQAAIAMHNSQLYEEIKSSKSELESTNQRLEKALKELSGFYTALSPLAPAESVTQLMDAIIERLMEATGADAAVIRLRNKEGGFYWAAHRGFPDYYLKAAGSPPPGSALEWVFNTGEPILAPDIAADPRLKGKVQLQAGLRSCAMLPLKIRNEPHGILHLASRQLDYFDEEQKEQLMAIARQMGIALENREHYDSLRASRDELEKALKIKEQFLSVISHELRTPLNVVMGYTETVVEGVFGEINSEQREALKKVLSCANDQLAIINNILYATSLEAGKVRVEGRSVNLEDFLNQLEAHCTPPSDKELILNWDYSPTLPIVIVDTEVLRQILYNLIDNAIKFTDKGHVTVSARRVAETNTVQFRVSDTGIGISDEKLGLIFEKFYQVDSSDTRTYGGVGLGLHIVKKFTELLGGKVEVESEFGKGSTFAVTIPCERK